MAANDKITIKFVPEGDERLIKAFEGLAKGQRKFNQQNKKGADGLKKYNRNQMRVTKGNQALGGSFAVIRSKILLFNFAIGVLGVKAITNFAQQAAKVEAMGRAFDTLSGGVNKGSAAIGKLRRATNGTMDDFSLFQQANNAMILGVTKNSSEMAEMFDIAQRLGRALGRDTASSVESLITGIGRQSRLMLDNIGIIVKSDEAYEKYAKTLNTTADKLTDSQKKQAFLNATMESARAKVASLGRENISSVDSFDRFIAASKNTAVALGNVLLPSITSVLEGIVDLSDELRGVFRLARDGREDFNLFNTEIETFSSSIDGLSVEELEKQLKDFQSQLKGLPESTKEAVKGVTEVGDLDLSTMSIIMPEVDDTAVITLGEYNAKNKDLGNTLTELSPMLGIINGDLLAIDENTKSSSESLSGLSVSIDTDVLIEKIKLLREAIKALKGDSGETVSMYEQLSDAAKKSFDAQIKQSIAAGKEYKNTGLAAQDAAEKTLTAQAQEVIALAIKKAFIALPYPINLVLGAAAGAAAGSLLQGAVNSAKALKFEQGGLVGGRRHSQGGTMIEAEQGEFVMSRNAVNAVGVEAMNRINAGGGAGNVNISFAGNVMSQDFIEDEAIPMIKEAIRRGADIGVS